MTPVHSVFIIDDEPWTLVYLEKLFDREDLGFRVIGTERSSSQAVRIIEREKPDVVVTDIRMPDITGIELMKLLREKEMSCEIVIVSAFAEFSYAQEAIHEGAFEYCLKPVKLGMVESIFKRLNVKFAAKDGQSQSEDIPADEENNFGKLLRYIEEHYSSRLYLKEIASRFYLTPNYCCNLFLKVKNMTFSQYVTQLRMQRAQVLLSSTEIPIIRIAESVGFEDYAYFNRVFKKFFGMTPSEYRKSVEKK